MAEEKKTPQGNGADAAKEKAKSNGRTPSPKKRHLQSLRRQERNRCFKARVNTAVRAYRSSVAAGDKEASQQSLSAVYSLLDKGVKTGRFKLNKAARTKSRLTV